jgi:hypothetical protein
LPVHSADTIADALKILEQARAVLSPDDKRYFVEEIEQIASRLGSQIARPQTFFGFLSAELDAQREKEEKPDGGRPVDRPLATAMHALANLFIQAMGGHLETWCVPGGSNSYFPRFAAACLAPLLDEGEGNLVPRLSKFWQREREKMRPKQRFE